MQPTGSSFRFSFTALLQAKLVKRGVSVRHLIEVSGYLNFCQVRTINAGFHHKSYESAVDHHWISRGCQLR